MPNPHLTATGTPWMGSSTPTVTRPPSTSMPAMLSWSGGQGKPTDSTTPNVVDTRGNGNGRGDGQGDGQVTGVASIDSLTGPITNPTDLDDEIWALAVQAADPITNPGYALSAEGQKLKAAGIMPGSDQWVMHFGVPQIVATSGRTGEPVTTGIRSGDTTTDYMDEYGQIIEGGKPIMTGQGKYLMDQYDEPGTYEEKVAKYYADREAEQAQQTGGDPNYGYGYGYDPGGGGGYAGGDGYALGVKGFHRGRPENISPWARNIAGTPMLPVAGSGAGASMAAADELYALASGKKAFSMTPEEQGILALLNA